MDFNSRWTILRLGACASLALLYGAAPAHAQSLADVAAQIRDLRQELAAQQHIVERQAKQLEQQRQEIDRLLGQAQCCRPEQNGTASGSLPNQAPAPPAMAQSQPIAPALPAAPVGEAPELARVEQQVEAVPQGQGVLTRAGQFILEPSLEYTSSSSNRLVFRGVELIPGIQVGVIEASDAKRDTLVAAGTVRYGITDFLELEARIPYFFRRDRVEALQQRDDVTTQQSSLNGHDLGDIELGLRYQFNRPVGEQPIFVGSLRVKTATGKSPFSVPFDEFGVASKLATGSGFWAVQPSLNFLLPSDPAVIFGGVSYLYQIPRNIDRDIGGIRIDRVEPGHAISGNLGFGFALNPRFSFSLGYRHSYISSSRTMIGSNISRSGSFQVGAFTMGMSYRVTPRQTVNFGVEVGATKDAPDVSIVLRAPFSTR